MAKLKENVSILLSLSISSYLIYIPAICIIAYRRFILNDEDFYYYSIYSALQRMPVFSFEYWSFVFLGVFIFIVSKIFYSKMSILNYYPLFFIVILVSFLVLNLEYVGAYAALDYMPDRNQFYNEYIEFICGSSEYNCYTRVIIMNLSFSIILGYVYVVIFIIFMKLFSYVMRLVPDI